MMRVLGLAIVLIWLIVVPMMLLGVRPARVCHGQPLPHAGGTTDCR